MFNKRSLLFLGLAIIGLAVLMSMSVPQTQAAGPLDRFIVVAKSDADFAALRAEALKMGAKILKEMPETKSLVVSASASVKAQVKASPRTQGVAKDGIRSLVRPELKADLFGQSKVERNRIDMKNVLGLKKVNPDPAFSLDGLMWNVLRIRAPEAWKLSTGDPAVKVGVADTGLDFTHSELKSQIADVVDFTYLENEPGYAPICKTYYGYSDADFAAAYGGPEKTDWNGHGSWIGGNIAAALDGVGINGIAPNVKLVALKISQWCGSAYDSEIIAAFLYAANNGIDVVSISFGGYLDRNDPEQETIYQQYVDTVNYARKKGTLIVASAGNEHLRIGAGGQVLSHGPLTTPGAAFEDYFGLWENPAGISGVIDVSATGNVVAAPSATCPADTTGSSATCKPKSDAHQSFGIGKKNQLAYYSNYGPRIDIAAPGGARKFNLPVWDRGGTPGFPVTTADGYNAYEDYSITSNWAMEIPCYYNLGAGFYPNDCYSTIQGTSMATPHVSAAAALVASRLPMVRHKPEAIAAILKMGAQKIFGNATPVLSGTDKSASDLTNVVCANGYCHLGGPAVSDREAYGAGLVDALTMMGLSLKDIPLK